ncbi:hypothetical protein FT663_01236 [Candidozyma haemuli var. vulneris]|uniref:PCI domain-containing protein n=1 Tax=Candidozyma haemuli TaxID=45357 RepID=A0A2V1AXI4_9ASCO|nr:hypothetical protein CXQ85_005103 [[Candida] haemuloni]KAF3992245.1 hypothetical protein FT662_01262 [[Candida] haemuloni var. vulneris]KAF3994658.1 hypothetical protein FT663_01236 [[Candida] haemuloni var. vulneris]PVH22532.1 hypothetical protein CXQ85_005103 [[Candida] haemuloni]
MALSKLAGELYQLYDHDKYAECQRLLPALKVELIKHNLLVPVPSNSQSTDQINDLKISERILEIGALSSLLTHDYAGFENFFASLRPFYTSTKLHGKSETNTDATKIIALYLLYLLSQGLISKFHVELETIYNSPSFNVEKDKYLNYPIDLERNLMEGNYIKIWKLLQNEGSLPSKEFHLFTQTLINTLRFEIAKSIEKTNDSIPVSNCRTLLYFPQEQSDKAFEEALKEDLEVEDWIFKDGVIYFNTKKSQGAFTADNSSIISNVLDYAEQIESIV